MEVVAVRPLKMELLDLAEGREKARLLKRLMVTSYVTVTGSANEHFVAKTVHVLASCCSFCCSYCCEHQHHHSLHAAIAKIFTGRAR